jgi:hypothetical protein
MLHAVQSDPVLTQLSLLAAAAVAMILVAWFFVANQRWIRLLVSDDPDLRSDSVAEPKRWFGTAGSRLRRLLDRLRTPTAQPELDLARRQTMNRFIAFCALAPIALFGLPVASSVISFYATTEIKRGGWIGVIFLFVLGGILSYWLYRLALATFRFGNGLLYRPTEFAISIFGVIAVLFVAWIVAGSPIGRFQI